MDHFYGIYGVGAVIIIVSSQYFNRNNFTLFLGGYLIGSVTEYVISFLVEILLQTKWWDYSNNILNVNGRICLLYSIFWGSLTIFIDCIATCYAQDVFITRMVITNDIEVQDLEERREKYKKIEENKMLRHFIYTYWNDKKMILTFPNIKIEDKDGNIIYVDSLLPEIQPYYKKIFEK